MPRIPNPTAEKPSFFQRVAGFDIGKWARRAFGLAALGAIASGTPDAPRPDTVAAPSREGTVDVTPTSKETTLPAANVLESLRNAPDTLKTPDGLTGKDIAKAVAANPDALRATVNFAKADKPARKAYLSRLSLQERADAADLDAIGQAELAALSPEDMRDAISINPESKPVANASDARLSKELRLAKHEAKARHAKTKTLQNVLTFLDRLGKNLSNINYE
jgi:hypothetical protein